MYPAKLGSYFLCAVSVLNGDREKLLSRMIYRPQFRSCYKLLLSWSLLSPFIRETYGDQPSNSAN